MQLRFHLRDMVKVIGHTWKSRLCWPLSCSLCFVTEKTTQNWLSTKPSPKMSVNCIIFIHEGPLRWSTNTPNNTLHSSINYYYTVKWQRELFQHEEKFLLLICTSEWGKNWIFKEVQDNKKVGPKYHLIDSSLVQDCVTSYRRLCCVCYTLWYNNFPIL